MKIQPVVLCGGMGTRLWPLSRTQLPKQLLPLMSEQSLLQETLQRVCAADWLSPQIISHYDYRFMLLEQLRQSGVQDFELLLEPFSRNTAPAVAAACLHAIRQHSDCLLLVTPSDHVVADAALFQQCIEQASAIALDGSLVLFGVEPIHAATGFGYIKRGDSLCSDDLFHVDQYIEKPKAERAEQFVQSGEYYWNSGVFLFKASVMLTWFEQYAPEILQAMQQAVESMAMKDDYEVLSTAYESCPAISLDYAIVEHISNRVVMPLKTTWSDVGSYNALCDASPLKDEAGNVCRGDVMVKYCHDSYLHTDEQLLIGLGLEHLIVVATKDAVLVAERSQDQAVKAIVEQLRADGRSEVDEHPRVYRPWGHYELLAAGAGYKTKRIVIKPGASLSLQRHQQRSEHWVVVSGVATVVRGSEEFELEANHSTYIPVRVKHRLSNLTNQSLEIIEIQSGGYLGEDDIERFVDDYDRVD